MQLYKAKNFTVCIMIALAIVSCLLAGESMARKRRGEDIVLYNGNIVMRGGKRQGNIVVGGSGGGGEEFGGFMPFMFGRRR